MFFACWWLLALLAIMGSQDLELFEIDIIW